MARRKRLPSDTEIVAAANAEVEQLLSPAPAKRARRKRKDPADEVQYPVDGDLRKDVVKNVPKGWQPLLLTPEDAERWMQWGAVKEERREGSMRPAFALSGEGTTDFKVGGLTLYKIPSAIYERRQKMSHAADAERMATVKKQARRSPGGEYVETRE